MRRSLASLTLASALAFGRVASAEPSDPGHVSQPSWGARLAAARAKLVDRKLRQAQRELFALALEAPTENDRVLALELSKLAGELALRDEAIPTTAVTGRPVTMRSPDELTLLYTSSLLYGIGTGIWFLLETEPDSAVTATLPFAAMTALPVIAVATVDGQARFARGVPHAIAAGLYLGLGQGVFTVGFQHGIAEAGAGDAWKPEVVAGVLWGGATVGAITGGSLGASLVTTPGRVSFTASTTLWSGTITGLAAAALLPDDEHRRARAFAIGTVGYDAGLASGLLLAGSVSPSVARVRLVDLAAAAAALASTGTYLSFSGAPDRQTTEGIAAAGALAGFGAGWILTRGMTPDAPTERAHGFFAWHPSIEPVPAGAALGIRGSF